MSLKAKIEAVLFLTQQPIRAQAIAQLINVDVQLVRQTVLELISEYEQREGGGIEIASDEEGYSFQAKEEYSSLMNEFAPIEMSAALLRTLSAIAIKQPIMQSEIIRIRGAGAYEHIRELVIKELVAKKDDDGRSPTLHTTKKFQEYFRLTKGGNELRIFLKKEMRREQKEHDAAAAAADGTPLEGVAGDAQLQIPMDGSTPANIPDESTLNSRVYLELSNSKSSSSEDSAEKLIEASPDDTPVAQAPAEAIEVQFEVEEEETTSAVAPTQHNNDNEQTIAAPDMNPGSTLIV